MVPGEYIILVRAMYEVRMFGDPGLGKSPVIRMKVDVEVDEGDDVVVVEGLGVVPDVVDGWMMGDWISLGVCVKPGAKEAIISGVDCACGELSLAKTSGRSRIVPGQLRPLSLRIKQEQRLADSIEQIPFTIHTQQEGRRRKLVTQLALRHFTLQDPKPFQITFASPHISLTGTPSQVSRATVVPPADPHSAGQQPPVILALHGAGVDAASDFWSGAMPQRPGGWAVLPTGKNEWGEDWHGGSMEDSWAARQSVGDQLCKVGVSLGEKTLLVLREHGMW
jgi:hypothetical protein